MDRIKILLATQKALLGNITNNMRAITIGFNGVIVLRGYFYSEPSEEEEEVLSEITTEIAADFTGEELRKLEDIREEAIATQQPLNELKGLDEWVFVRCEREL